MLNSGHVAKKRNSFVQQMLLEKSQEFGEHLFLLCSHIQQNMGSFSEHKWSALVEPKECERFADMLANSESQEKSEENLEDYGIVLGMLNLHTFIYVARTLQKCQRVRVKFAKSSVFLEDPTAVRH
ncbi:hypothetical protein H5410_035830 [Solanum commersonii]|uniref:Uncharacterized protein n=1 Tax=Solanum commersonii TaxID=4109 RepID=A0A9J5Y6C2_SOLCO|nr:hypothetical protein H5410_035830 [Solanum commersonii]